MSIAKYDWLNGAVAQFNESQSCRSRDKPHCRQIGSAQKALPPSQATSAKRQLN